MSILKHSQRLIVSAALTATLLTGCMMSNGDAPEANSDMVKTEMRNDVGAVAPVEAGAEAAKERLAVTEPLPAESADYAGDGVEESMDYAGAAEEASAMAEFEAPATASPASTDSGAAVSERAEAEMVAPEQAPPLRAGEVDDNAQWDDYLLYRRNYAGPGIHPVDISEQYVIEVTDGQGYPVLGAQVTVLLPGQRQQEIFSGRTMANGQLLFHPLALDLPLEQADEFLVNVAYGNGSHQFTLTRFDAQPATDFIDHWTVTLDANRPPAEALNSGCDVLG